MIKKGYSYPRNFYGKMRILIVHPCKGFYGGAEEVLFQLVSYLGNQGHEVQLVTKDAPQELVDKLVSKGPTGIYDWHSFRMMRYWVQKLSKWADVVNVHNFPATLTTFPNKKSIVYMCNEPAELFTNWKRKPIEAFNRWWVRESKMKVVVADQMNSNRFKEIYRIEPSIIPYGVDYEFWSQGRGIQKMVKDYLRLLQVGTITPYKNQLESIRTLEHLVDEGINASLALVGSITDRYYYERVLKPFIEDYGLGGYIEVAGQLSHEELRDLYKSCDILLHPAQGQGGWLVPFEAMCAGLPVITTPTFTASNLIQKYNLGVVTDDLHSAVLGGDYKLLNTETIKEWVKENLTWGKFGESMVKVFKEALNGRDL